MSTRFGERIRSLRKFHGLLLRQVASFLEMDTALLSKIERGERPNKKEQVLQIADLFEVDKGQLITLWLADQVMDILKDEELADAALKEVTKNITND